MKTLAIVFRKEMREIFRDRRTLIALGLAALATPTVLVVISQVSTKTATQTYTVGYSGDIPTGLDILLTATGLTLEQVADPAAAAKQQVDLGVVFQPAEIDEWYDPTRQSAQIADTRLQRGRCLGGVVLAEHRLQARVGDLRALPRRVVVLVDLGGQEGHPEVHLLLGRGRRVGDHLELEARRAQQDVKPGRDLAAVPDRVRLRRGLGRHLRDDYQHERRGQGGKPDRHQCAPVAHDLAQLFPEDDAERFHYLSTSSRKASSRSRCAPLTSAVRPVATTLPS